jgi:hypothetical protein
MQRAGTHKVPGRARSTSVPIQVLRARVLIGQRAGADARPLRGRITRGFTMIFHASIPADDPERVAKVVAELWRGTYHPFIAPGTYVVLANDELGTELEVGPRGVELIPSAGEVGFQPSPSPRLYSEVHINMSTVLTYQEVLTIASREGWVARICDRGGFFTLVEFWLENKFMLELMNDNEAARYRSIMNANFWTKGPPPGAAS